MRRLAGLVSLATAVAADTLNIFQAFDKERYLAEATAAMRQAYAVPLARRSGRRYRWFILYREPLNATIICAAAKQAHESRAAAWAEYTGCSDLGTAIPDDSCAVRDAPSTLKTVNVFRLETIPKVLEDIHALTRRAYDARSKCKKRRELISYFNLAPDAIDRFLLPFGVGKVAV